MRARRPRASGDPKLAVGYIRVSKDEQRLSPEAQREAIRRWCEREGLTLVSDHADELTSVTPIHNRPGLTGALADLTVHGAGVLVVARRDRLARDPILTAMIERAAGESGARVMSAGGEANGDDPTSVLMRRILDAFAEYERLMIKARTKAALAVKKRRGECIGSRTPYGWRVRADGVHVEADPREGQVVAMARELRATGRTYQGSRMSWRGAGIWGATGARCTRGRCYGS